MWYHFLLVYFWKEQTNEWDKIENQEIDPKKYSQLTLALEQNIMENNLQQMMLERLTSMRKKKKRKVNADTDLIHKNVKLK